jgi:hypothetical protein
MRTDFGTFSGLVVVKEPYRVGKKYKNYFFKLFFTGVLTQCTSCCSAGIGRERRSPHGFHANGS